MVLCIDLGATKIKGALMENGTVYVWREVPTDAASPATIEAGLAALTDSLLRMEIPAEKSNSGHGTESPRKAMRAVTSVGIASAGDVDPKTGVVTYATGNLPGFSGFDFVRFFQTHYGLACRAVNDAQGALLGEVFYGAGQDFSGQNIAMLTLGSGVGGAYFSDGRIVNDPGIDFARFGHLCLTEGGRACNCGRSGCIEQYVSGRALNRMTEAAGLAAQELFDAVRAGNPAARRVLDDYLDLLSLAVGRVLKTVPAELLILGGGVTEGAGELMDDFLAAQPIHTVRAVLGNRAGVYGAFCLTEARECDII